MPNYYIEDDFGKTGKINDDDDRLIIYYFGELMNDD